jgi:hypothetical protein
MQQYVELSNTFWKRKSGAHFKNKIQHKISNKFNKYKRTRLSSSRQLWHQSAAGTFVSLCASDGQLYADVFAERFFADYNRQSGGRFTKTNQTKSATHFKNKRAPVCSVHVSFGINQQLALLCVTDTGSFMQSGALVTRTENQEHIPKTQYNTKSAQKFKNKRAPVSCVHVRFGINQKLEHLCVTFPCREMQSGVSISITENQKHISRTQYTSYTKSATNFINISALVFRVHVSFGINQQQAHLRVTITGSFMQSGYMWTRTENQEYISKTQCDTKSATYFKHECSSRRVQSYGPRLLTQFSSVIK